MYDTHASALLGSPIVSGRVPHPVPCSLATLSLGLGSARMPSAARPAEALAEGAETLRAPGRHSRAAPARRGSVACRLPADAVRRPPLPSCAALIAFEYDDLAG
jgi:hypothetical protein